jgi:hypothetical protein
MKCPKCQIENKDVAKICRKCGTDLLQAPLWRPTWKWHARTLVVIYSILIVMFFLLNSMLRPYLRQIPKDITPWLKDMPKQESVG